MLDLVRHAEPAILRVIRKSRLTARATIVSKNGFCFRRPDGYMHSDNHRDENKRLHTVASFWLQFPRAACVASARADCSCRSRSVMRLSFLPPSLQDSKNIHSWHCAFVTWWLDERHHRQHPSSHIQRAVHLILKTIGRKVCFGGETMNTTRWCAIPVMLGLTLLTFSCQSPQQTNSNKMPPVASRCASGGPGAGQHVLGRSRSRQCRVPSPHRKILLRSRKSSPWDPRPRCSPKRRLTARCPL